MLFSHKYIGTILTITCWLFSSIYTSNVLADNSESIVDDKFIEYLIEAEGMRSLEVNSADVTDIMNSIILSKGSKPSYSELINLWSNAPDNDPSKILLALGMFSAGVSHNEREAMELASKANNSFFENNFKHKITQENLAGDSYSWLIDHADFTVPKSLPEKYPRIVSEDTPFWGGARDAYFNIEGSGDWPIFSSVEQGNWIRALDDIESPDKEVWRGSIRNTSLKSLEKFRGLLVHNPSYLLNNLNRYTFPKGSQQWLNYWKFSGAYEYITHKRYQVARNEFYESFKQQLLIENNGKTVTAETFAKFYIDFVEWCFTGHAGRSEGAKTIFDILETAPWTELVGNHIWDHTDEITLRMVGGMLLLTDKEDEFISYTNWLVENEHGSLVGELIGLAAMSDKLTKNIVKRLDAPVIWGTFNKTPLMYAAHFDNADAYNKILQLFPDLPLQVTKNGEEYSNLPEIGGRNVLMYALENASYSFINKILNEDWIKNLNRTDSANRDFGDYIDMNEQLIGIEKTDVVNRLKRIGLLVKPNVIN